MTRFSKINYIGYSRGSIAALVRFSLLLEYGEKVNVTALLSATAGVIFIQGVGYLKMILSQAFIDQCEKNEVYYIADYSTKPNALSLFAAAFSKIVALRYKERHNVFLHREDPKILIFIFRSSVKD